MTAVSSRNIADLYPPEIIAVLGEIEKIPEVATSELPDYPLIQRGIDEKGCPFLLVFVPRFAPLTYFAVNRFQDIRCWQVKRHGDSPGFKLFTKHDLELLSQIATGEKCDEARKKIFR